jgi:4-hydroxybenzoyl-CoA reductase subunit alpha
MTDAMESGERAAPLRSVEPSDPCIGVPRGLLDGVDRAAGRVAYVDDLRLPGLLHGCFLRSPHAHARIVSIDATDARASPGVHAVITGQETPHRYGVMPAGRDETGLAQEKVRYLGEEVVAVAALRADVARDAAAKVRVVYEPLPACLDVERATHPDAPRIHAEYERNIAREYHHVFGEPDVGFAKADVIVEDTFFHPRVTHAAIEPHGTIAQWGSGDTVTLWTSTQTPRHVQRGIATALGVPERSVRVIPCAVGGGFGGKSETLPHDVAAAVLARITGRPVRFSLSREEVFTLHRGRPESHIKMRLGMSRDGRITAVECETIQDGGAYVSYGVATILYSGALLAAIYDIRDFRFDGYRILTNKPPCGAMRGHGTIGARHAFESLLDRAAVQMGLDPAEARRRDLLRPNTVTANQLRVTSYGYPECIERVVEASGWKEKRGRLPFGRGVGLAGSHYVSGAANSIVRGDHPQATVSLLAERDGSVSLFTGASEIGQGSDTAQAVIVASTLGLRPEDIRIVSGDTALTPFDQGTYSSRVTMMTGRATLDAAKLLARRLRTEAAKALDVSESQLELRSGQIATRDGRRSLSFHDALSLAVEKEGALLYKGSFWTPRAARGGSFRGAGVGPGVSYSYAAQVVEVAIDLETGELRVDRVWAAHDCGRALNPLAVRGQVQGSVWMGLAQALVEEQRFSEQGLLFNGSLLEYKMPTSLDSPPVDVFIVESDDPDGPFGAKEAGEGSLAAVIPALANAIYDAIGVWINDLPITPEKVLAALDESQNVGARPRRRTIHPTVPPLETVDCSP